MKRFSGDSGTILIVDDEQANIQVVGTILSAFGYDLMIAKDGEQALERVRAKTPDLVLLDVMLPGLSGFETCHAMREIGAMKNVPIIFLSADDGKNTIVKALEIGGVDYVTKPFNKAELLARVRAHLELKTTRDECGILLLKTERFLEIMAHDLRNWVGSANFSSHLLQELEGQSEQAQRITNSITESTTHALAFIDEYLANAQESRSVLEMDEKVFDLKRMVELSLKGHEEEAATKEIHLALTAAEDDIKVKSDRTAVLRVFENLLTNAIKFSAPKSQVEIRIEEEPAVALVIRDEGPGFSEQDRAQLFQPYTRLSARPTGGEISTGLGLSVVKQLCDQLGLELEVATPVKGAEVRVVFPREW